MGGYGNPRERDPEAVLHDVREGKVSLAQAKTEYGVVIDAKTITVDEEKTREMRKK